MITLALDGWRIDESYLQRLQRLLAAETQHQGVISARVVDAETMKRFNLDYAGSDCATDVLSFSYVEETDSEQTTPDSLLGDIAISRKHIISQAETAGTDEDTELLLLLAHGSLHILGFDHVSGKDQSRMEELQGRIMENLGLDYRDFGWQAE